MTIASRLADKYAAKAVPKADEMPPWMLDRAQAARYDMPDMGLYENQARLFTRLSWVYSAVTIVGQTCALQELNVTKTWGEKKRDITNHPFEQLLKRPNPLHSRFEFISNTIQYLALNGNSYWYLNRTQPDEKPSELWVIPSWRIKPLPDGNMYIAGYEYDPGSGARTIAIPAWQIVHFKGFNPLSEFFGVSGVEPVAISAETDLESQKWSRRFYGKNNARLPGILAFRDQIPNDIAWERIKHDVERSAETRNLLMLRGVGDRIEWLKAAATQEEMQQLEARKFTKEEIYAIFAPGLASMLDVNATEANSKAGKQTFLEMAIWPRLVAMAQKMTIDILPSYGKNLEADFDDPRQVDRALELAEQTAYAVSHTLDEVRQKYYDDQQLGDERGALLAAQVGQNTPGPSSETPPAAEPVPEEPAPDNPDLAAAMRADLAAWRRKALNAMKAGKPPLVSFESDAIPPEMHAGIWARLSDCKTAGDVREVFETAMVDGTPDLAGELKRANDLLEMALA